MPPACSFFGVFFININIVRKIVTLIFNPHKTNQGEFKHEVRQFQKPYDNQQAEQISLMV